MVDSSSPQPTDAYLEELIAGYALDALTPEEVVEVEHYLRHRPDLVEKLHEFQNVMGYLGQISSQTPPANLRAKILAIPQMQSETAPAQPPVRMPPRRWSWRVAWGAIAALLVVGLLIDNVLLRQRLTVLQAELTHAADEENYVFLLQGAEESINASAKVIVDAHAGDVLLGVHSLPPLPNHEAYQLWAFTDDQTKVLCGQFNTDETGQAIAYFSVSPEIYTSPITFMRISASEDEWVMTSESS